MKPDNKTGGIWIYALGLIPVVWLALLIAPALSGGLSAVVEYFPSAINTPFVIHWCGDSVKAVLILSPPMAWGSGFISPPAAITEGARNTVRQNGATPEP